MWSRERSTRMMSWSGPNVGQPRHLRLLAIHFPAERMEELTWMRAPREASMRKPMRARTTQARRTMRARTMRARTTQARRTMRARTTQVRRTMQARRTTQARRTLARTMPRKRPTEEATAATTAAAAPLRARDPSATPRFLHSRSRGSWSSCDDVHAAADSGDGRSPEYHVFSF